MNRSKFYASLGKQNQQQVDGQEAILNEAERRGASLQLTAYALATAKHETGNTFKPIEENLYYTTPERIRAVWPKRFPTVESAVPYLRNPRPLANKVYGNREDLGNGGGDDGYNYRGRGLPQVTGKANYAKWGLTSNPGDALKMPVAVRILFDGLEKGMFTGRKASGFKDYKSMRAAVNGDGSLNGATVAAYADAYERALRAAGYSASKVPVGVPEIVGAGAVITAAETSGTSSWWLIGIVVLVAVGITIVRLNRK